MNINRNLKAEDFNGRNEQAARVVAECLRQLGHEAFLVGGCVRDRLMGNEPNDADVATSAVPDVVMQIFPRTHAVGAAFGVVLVVETVDEEDEVVEVATFRRDGGYSDGRRPNSVSFCQAEEDVRRRDFTINGLLFDLDKEEVIDFVGGLGDLEASVVRAIGDPEQRFAEDRLRMLRAVRFAARFGFGMEIKTAKAIWRNAAAICDVSQERIFKEIDGMLRSRNPEQAFRQMKDLRLLEHAFPEIHAMVGCTQPPEFHPEGDVFEHTMLLLREVGKMPVEARHDALAWAVLLHDVGKPPAAEPREDGQNRFRHHAKLGTELSETILRRFGCSREFIMTICDAVAVHMKLADAPKMKKSKVRRILGHPEIMLHLALHRLDCMHSSGNGESFEFLVNARAEYLVEPAVPPPLLRGKDLIERGFKPGPEIGAILREAEELQLEDKLEDREQALVWLEERLDSGGHGE